MSALPPKADIQIVYDPKDLGLGIGSKIMGLRPGAQAGLHFCSLHVHPTPAWRSA